MKTKNSILMMLLILLATSYLNAQLPSWVPAPGRVNVLTQSNGLLTNTFKSTTAPYYESFFTSDIVGAYCTAVLNPYFGDYGALVFFGGGHAATNDNSVMILEFGKDSSTFHRMTNPSPIYGSDSSPTTKWDNAKKADVNSTVFADTAYAEYLVDGQPVSVHSYGAGDVIGPQNGGASYGTFMQVILSAGSVNGYVGGEVAHKVDFNTLNGYADGANPSYSWTRVAKGSMKYGNPPVWTTYVPSQQRIYYEALDEHPPRWFDLNNNTYNTGTGTTRFASYDNFNNGIMFAVPQRNLVLFCDIFQGLLRIKYLDVSVAQPSWSSVVTLSAPIEIAEFWESGLWCEDNNRILIGNVKNDDNAIYEISIPPTNISSTAWSVERVPLTAGDRIGWAMDPGNFQKWRYNSKIKAVVYMPYANTYGDDSVFVYRPRNINSTTNINELNEESISFTTSPNPFNSFTTIAIASDVPLKNATLQVFDMQGKLIADLTNQLKGQIIRFKSDDLSEGLYIIRLNSDKKIVTRKVCIMNN